MLYYSLCGRTGLLEQFGDLEVVYPGNSVAFSIQLCEDKHSPK